ncbi:MAG: cell division protein FtsI (penicillin-binding protein 3), partial [Cellvibrionaceae bacterium]
MRAKVKIASIVRWRFYFVLSVMIAFMLALVWYLATLQIVPNADRGYEFLQRQGLDRTLRVEPIPALRGMITDRHGKPLAVSTPVTSLWAHPQQLIEAESQWPPLLAALNIGRDELAQKLQRFQQKEFMYLQRQMTPEAAENILQWHIPGVYDQQEQKRFYPAGEITAHLLGFTNIDDRGQEGIELAYDHWLKSEAGAKQVLKDRTGRVFKDVRQLSAAKPGNTLALSIDLRLQYLAYRELKEATLAHRASSGSIVLLDAETGEVLAMVNQPSFNPNDRREFKANALRNRAMTDQFEPGSTMKPLTIMAALESGSITANTTIDTHPGYLKVGQKTLHDPVNYGTIDIKKIIQKSSQVGLTKISLALQGDAIRDLFFRVGLGRDTGTGFPGESSGLLPHHARWQPIVQANFSFGYGLSLTAVQLAQAYSVIANNGI